MAPGRRGTDAAYGGTVLKKKSTLRTAWDNPLYGGQLLSCAAQAKKNAASGCILKGRVYEKVLFAIK